jgi:general stress protein 26
VSGHAELVEDLAKKQQLWSKMDEAWFPEGPDGPNVALVRVRISHANYWDVKANKLVQLYAMAKAALTGQPPRNIGDTGEVRMH